LKQVAAVRCRCAATLTGAVSRRKSGAIIENTPNLRKK